MATPKWYVNGLKRVMDGTLDLDAVSAFKMALVTSTYVPDQALHDFRDDLGANEASGGSGYTAGGFSLGTPTLTITSLTVKVDWADFTATIVGGPFAFRYGVIYRARGGLASADELLGYVDFGAQSATDVTIAITNTDPLSITAA